MGRELGRFLEQRRDELGLSRRDVARLAELSYSYVSQLETGEKEPALKAVRSLAPVLDVAVEELASMAAGGTWAGTSYSSDSFMSAPMAMASPAPSGGPSPERVREKTLLSLERRLRDVPPLERIALLNELIAQAVAELNGDTGRR